MELRIEPCPRQHAIRGQLVPAAQPRRPLDESVAAILMRALHATGRGVEALDRYQQIRTRLVADLGVDPGTELQQLLRQILRGELDPPPRAAPTAGPLPPQQLPADVREFTGRHRELTHLDALLADQAADASSSKEQPPQTPLIVAVTGTAGVGKTGLVVHWRTVFATGFRTESCTSTFGVTTRINRWRPKRHWRGC